MPQNIEREVSLFFRRDGSDKVYQTQIHCIGSSYTVDFQYGRRGSTFQTGTKTSSPVSLDAAIKIFEKLVSEKKSKGYIEGENTAAYVPPANTTSSEIQPQLLTAIDDDREAERVLKDSSIAIQEKMDGDRVIIVGELSGITAFNRLGKARAISEVIITDMQALISRTGSATLDGECIGDAFCAFDLLSVHGKDMRPEAFKERYRLLERWTGGRSGGRAGLLCVPTAFTAKEKKTLAQSLYKSGAEGWVGKQIDSPYLPGRSKLNFKRKFWEEASVLVTGMNDKASVRVSVFNEDDEQVDIGNVTIRSPMRVKEGDVIDVKYLNILPEGSLYQPTMLRVRNDQTVDACSLSQLKYRGEPRG